MQAFQEYVHGEGMPTIGTPTLPAIEGGLDSSDFYELGVRDEINFALSDITDGVAGETRITDPVVVYEQVRSVIADAGYLLPPPSSLLDIFSEMETEGDEAFALTRIKKFEPNEPEVVPCYLYFAFCKDDLTNTYDVLAEVVTQDELDSILYDEEVHQ